MKALYHITSTETDGIQAPADVQAKVWLRDGVHETEVWAEKLDITSGVDSGDLAGTITDVLAAMA